MKLVAISRVRNEVDIIEAFVRHHAVHFDKLIVLDDGSTDGTYDVLRSLQEAGLPLVLLREPSIGYEQGRYMTRLLNMAFDEFSADWVAPLDADEFVEPPQGSSLAETLPTNLTKPLRVCWNNFIWRLRDDDDPEPNPVKRLRLRLPPQEPDLAKVLVPAGLAAQGKLQLWQGNHGVWRDGQATPCESLDNVRLCHFPIRGINQFSTKIVLGYLQYCATPNWKREEGFHYIDPFRLLTEAPTSLAKSIESISRTYSLRDSSISVDEAREEPFRYDGGPLIFNCPREDMLTSILRFAELLAGDRAAVVERENAVAAALAVAPAEVALCAATPLQRIAELCSAAQESKTLLAEREGWQRDVATIQRRVDELETDLARMRQIVRAQDIELSSRFVRFARGIHRALSGEK